MIDSPCGTYVARTVATDLPGLAVGRPSKPLTRAFSLERAKGIEPS